MKRLHESDRERDRQIATERGRDKEREKKKGRPREGWRERMCKARGGGERGKDMEE